MVGAIIGDIAGSRFEWDNIKSKEFELFSEECRPTDDSNMTLAVAQALLQADGDWTKLPDLAVASMREFGKKYPHGYGKRFWAWLQSENPQPYESWGNGAAMRVSPCAWAASSLEEALLLSDLVTGVTHNHPKGMEGARAITAAVWLARHGAGIPEIRKHIREHYYPLDFTLDEIRKDYEFDVSCQGSIPQAIEAFLESDGFEDAIRNAISIGGDSDTIAAMASSIAEAFYGIPPDINYKARSFLDRTQLDVLSAFEGKYGTAEDKLRNTELTVEQMKKEKQLVSDRLELAIGACDYDQSQKAMIAVYDELVNAYVYNICGCVPLDSPKGFGYALYWIGERQYAYVGETIAQSRTEPFKDSTVFLPWRIIIRMAAEDNTCEGLLINPGHKAPHGGIIFLKREILLQIIKYAEETINGMPENVREALIKGI